MQHSKTTLILSPHLDDAVISCTDHILEINKTTNVEVITIFTEFGTRLPAPYHWSFIEKIGFKDVESFGAARREEDLKAMKLLDVEFQHLGFTDAGYRLNDKDEFTYSDYRKLTPFAPDSASSHTLEKLTKHFKSMPKDATIYLPLGIGGHIDHVLVREAAQNTWPSKQLHYYLEFPYALRPWKYRPSHLTKVFGKKISRLPISSTKREALECYKTQTPYIFKRPPQFSEWIFHPKG